MKIELSKAHIKVLIDALEAYNRVSLGQFKYGLQTILPERCFKIKPNDLDDLNDKLKLFLFPELSINETYGIGRCKKSDIAYEISSLLEQYLAMENFEPTNKEIFYDRKMSDPLKVSSEPLPTIGENDDYKYGFLPILDDKIIKYFENKDYESMWKLINKKGFPKSSRTKVIKKYKKYYLKIAKPYYKSENKS